MKLVITIVLLISLIVIGGYISGNQPTRDAVYNVETSLGINLEQRRLKVNSVELNVVFAGPTDGEPVVLLHGYPEFWYAWRDVMALLAKEGYRVIVPDQRGYNYSEKPRNIEQYTLDKLATDVSELINVLGYEQVYLAGHDFGGQVAWWAMMLFPNQIARFVIINKPHPKAIKDFQGENSSISWYRSFLKIPYLPGFVARLGNWYLLASNLRKTAAPETFPDSIMNQFRAAWDNQGAIHTMGAWYRANADISLPTTSNISVPGLFVLAPDDKFSPIEMGRKTSEHLSNGELLELSEGSHWVVQENPKLIADILQQQFRE